MAKFAQRSRGSLDLNRPAASRQEIAALPEFATLASHLRERGESLLPETLVYIARRACECGDREVLEVCGRLLNGHPTGNGGFTNGPCEPLISKHAAVFGFSSTADDRVEFRARCHNALWAAILAGEAKPHYEERFYAALKALVIDVGRSMAAERSRHNLNAPELESSDFEGVGSVDGETEAITGLVTGDIEAAIRRLPAPERDAAWLAWVMDWKIESKDDKDEKTVSRALGIGGRMVHKRLNSALALLREDPAIARIMDDHGWS